MEPKHGDKRNYRQETRYGETQVLTNSEGETVYQGPMSSVTESVTERYCEKCGKWVTARGIIGALLCPDCSTPWKKEYWEAQL